jgi:hypothetical protein
MAERVAEQAPTRMATVRHSKDPPLGNPQCRDATEPLGQGLSSLSVPSTEDVGTEQTGIFVETKYYALNFLLFFSKPKISLDGNAPEAVRWGVTFIRASPGRHTVRCFVPYVYLRHMGDSSVDVTVPRAGTASLRWQTPLGSLYLKGKWTVLDSPPSARSRRGGRNSAADTE